ncbi:MAG: hypothetical protein PHW04_18810 [Candidatus Wallbacteria bacterium]|nr:hypothetical protein [Candidatus Wallbacteria bacterium]
MTLLERLKRIRELKEYIKYKDSQFWEDSPYHDMKIAAARKELNDLNGSLITKILSSFF